MIGFILIERVENLRHM